MNKVSYIPKDYNSITPYLIVKGAAQAIEYYKKVFGATEVFRMNGPDGKVGHAELKIGNSHIMLADENPQMGQGHTSAATIGGSPVSLHIYLPHLGRGIERAKNGGAENLKEIPGHVGRADRQDEALHQEIVAAGDGWDRRAADAGPGEDCFGNDGARQQRSELQAQHRDYGDHGVAQGMAVDHLALGKA